eukprot:m.267836 g.267836  ORF g.267836 m.267836 type:complete len:56 (+) comp71830_c0_seq1:289-456(+)
MVCFSGVPFAICSFSPVAHQPWVSISHCKADSSEDLLYQQYSRLFERQERLHSSL